MPDMQEMWDPDPNRDVTPGPEGEKKDGELLKKKGKAAAQAAMRLWQSQDRLMARRLAQWEVNRLRREGVPNVQLIRDRQDIWKPWIPVNASPDAIPAVNKAASLCRRLRSIMFADPPAPDPVPRSAEEEDIAAAEFAGRALRDEQSEKKLDDVTKAGRAFDLASVYSSGFIRYWVGDRAGGTFKLQISAGVDSATGARAEHVSQAAWQVPGEVPWPDYVERYVAEDGTLVDSPKDAKEVEIPGLQSETLPGKSVRFMPHDAADVWEADGIQIGCFRTFGWLKNRFPEQLGNLSKDAKERLFRYRPEKDRKLATPEQREALKNPPDNEDARLVFVITTYYDGKKTAEYPRGLYLVTLADEVTLIQEDWCAEQDDGNIECLDIPVTQYKQFDKEGDPYGLGLMEIVGNAQEFRAEMISRLEEHVDRVTAPMVFVPLASNLEAKDFRRKRGLNIVPVLPGGAPSFENHPAFPNDAMNLFGIMSQEMDQASGLTQIAQGMESPQVQSGRHAQAIISQVHAGLSEPRQNTIRGYQRGCRIQLQLIRGFYDTPRRIGYVGEDGAFKEREWRGSDLRGTEDVELAVGSMTMLSPVAKVQLAEHLAQTGQFTLEELREVTRGNLGGMLGLQDDPFILRVKRQLDRWKQGPPDGWQPQMVDQPVVDPQTGQPVIDPATGQPQMQQVQVLDPVLGGIFVAFAADDEPHVAMMRRREIARMMSTTKYAVQPQQWRFGLDLEYQRALAASQGIQQNLPGQPPAQPISPAQRTDGQLAQPETPLPQETGSVQVQ